MPMRRPELASPQLESSALAVELSSSAASALKELSLSSWCIAPLYIYHFATVVDFSFEKYSGSTGHRYSWCQQRTYSGDADGETRTHILTVISLLVPGVPVFIRTTVLLGLEVNHG